MASTSCRIYTLAVLFTHILMTSAWSHKEYEMSSDQVCSRMGRRELPITFERPALVRDGGRLFSDWPGIRRYDCRWKVEGKKAGKGVTAVVQKVKLRKASEKDCMDYIQFKRESRVDKGPRVCGSVLFGILLEQNDTFPSPTPDTDIVLSEAVDPKSDWASLAAYGSIIDVEGEVMTYVHVAQKKIQPGDKIEMVVAYTAFQECREKVPEGSFHCGYGLCISSSLVKDGVINCPFADCIDEGSCHEARISNITKKILSKTQIERGGGADATSSSFAALFILVVICLAIYYLYRRYRKSRQLPGEVYGTVNGMAQQQAITGSGYIEIPGSASNLPYSADLSTQAVYALPYSLDPNDLPPVASAILPYPAQPTAPMYPPAIPTQQPNPPPSPSITKEGEPAPPPIGFIIAEVSAPPSTLPPTPPIARGTPPLQHVAPLQQIPRPQQTPPPPPPRPPAKTVEPPVKASAPADHVEPTEPCAPTQPTAPDEPNPPAAPNTSAAPNAPAEPCAPAEPSAPSPES